MMRKHGRRTLTVLAVGCAAVALVGCGGGASTRVVTTVTVTTTATTTSTTTETVTAPAPTSAAATTTAPSGPFPPGYPQVVAVASLPSQMQSLYSTEGHDQAVAIAPGVWAPLTPGADAVTAATAGVLDGFCASIKAYEAQYLGGQSEGGDCF